MHTKKDMINRGSKKNIIGGTVYNLSTRGTLDSLIDFRGKHCH